MHEKFSMYTYTLHSQRRNSIYHWNVIIPIYILGSTVCACVGPYRFSGNPDTAILLEVAKFLTAMILAHVQFVLRNMETLGCGPDSAIASGSASITLAV